MSQVEKSWLRIFRKSWQYIIQETYVNLIKSVSFHSNLNFGFFTSQSVFSLPKRASSQNCYYCWHYKIVGLAKPVSTIYGCTNVVWGQHSWHLKQENKASNFFGWCNNQSCRRGVISTCCITALFSARFST